MVKKDLTIIKFTIKNKILSITSNILLLLFILVLLFLLLYKIEWKVEVYGLIKPKKFVEIRTKVEGIIKEIYVNEGDYVTPDTLIAKIEDPNIQLSYEEIKTKFNLTKKSLERLKKLYEKNLVSYINVEEKEAELQLLRLNLDKIQNYSIISPVNGNILSPTELKLKKGNFVEAGDLIAVVADTNTMTVKVNIPENKINEVKPGQKAIIILNALPYTKYRTFQGRLEKVAPEAIFDGANAYFEGLVSMDKVSLIKENNDNLLLKPGMTARVKIVTKKCTVFQNFISHKIMGN